MAIVKQIHTISDDESGQGTIELVMMIPVILGVLFIGINAFAFLSEIALFDRVARAAVVSIASSPASDDSYASVCSSIKNTVDEQLHVGSSVKSVSGYRDGLDVRFRVEMVYRPSFFGRELRTNLFGIELGTLTHHIELAVDTFAFGPMRYV
ncbi:MAG: hypothetical protein J6Y65_00650 [Eggerthellaceae bacterium]|nr:hypothetical protein [Eggerthellaceae bacterium]